MDSFFAQLSDSVNQARTLLRESVGTSLEQRAVQTKLALEQYVGEHVVQLRLLALDPDVQQALAAPALAKLGVPLIASHMFAFYYGIMADLSPPVALAQALPDGTVLDGEVLDDGHPAWFDPAMIERPPVVGGKVKRFDASATLKVPGVVAVETLSHGAGPRIAILHATAGSGHKRAAQALADAIAGLSPGATVREVDTLVQSQMERVLNNMELVKREEFEAVKAMAQKAREENDALSQRIAVLESKLAPAPESASDTRAD